MNKSFLMTLSQIKWLYSFATLGFWRPLELGGRAILIAFLLQNSSKGMYPSNYSSCQIEVRAHGTEFKLMIYTLYQDWPPTNMPSSEEIFCFSALSFWTMSMLYLIAVKIYMYNFWICTCSSENAYLLVHWQLNVADILSCIEFLFKMQWLIHVFLQSCICAYTS